MKGERTAVRYSGEAPVRAIFGIELDCGKL